MRTAEILGSKEFDPSSLEGLTPAEVRASIPSDWVQAASKSGGEEVFRDPTNFGRQIRIMPGYPAGSRADLITTGCGWPIRGFSCWVGWTGFSWASERRSTARTAWNVVGSEPVNEDGVVNLRLFFFPDAELTVVARSAAFYAGDVPGLPDAPPDFAGSDAEVAAGDGVDGLAV